MADEISIPCTKMLGNDGSMALYDDTHPFPVVDSIYIKSYAGVMIDNQQIDDAPTSYTGPGLDVRGWQACWVEIIIRSTGTSTHVIRILPQFSINNGSSWDDFEEGLWASMYWEDVDTASGIRKIFLLPCGGVDQIRFRAIGTNTTGSNYFTVTVNARQFRGAYAVAHA